MLSKAQIKYIRSLTQQKYRKEHNVLVAEGDKIVREWLSSGTAIRMIVAEESWVGSNLSLIGRHPEAEVFQVPASVLSSVSSLQTPNQVLIVAAMPAPPAGLPEGGWMLLLEQLQDPGNMGTIIRIADWFGIPHIVLSPDCADVYNPKVIQAAMGGHLRISFHVADLSAFIPVCPVPVYAATLDGRPMREFSPSESGALLVGNESRGISDALLPLVQQRITIPRRGGAESLNAAVATGILCSCLLP